MNDFGMTCITKLYFSLMHEKRYCFYCYYFLYYRLKNMKNLQSSCRYANPFADPKAIFNLVDQSIGGLPLPELLALVR